MKTNETINRYRRGDDYNPDAVISHLCSELQKVNECKELLPNVRSRGDYFNSQKEVGCSIKNLEKASETAFSRALFNQKYIPINGNLTVMLDYEVVLSEDKAQKVDLLGFDLAENKLLAIEYKYNPHGSDTGIEYGLFEAFIYGSLLEKYIRNRKKSEIKKEILFRLDELGLSYLSNLVGGNEFTSEFILCAPVSYFLEFTKNSSKRALKRFNRITAIENCLADHSKTQTRSTFGGYLPIAEISHNRQIVIRKDDGKNTFPFLMTTVPLIKNVKETTIEIRQE